jgi:hypothetical protein
MASNIDPTDDGSKYVWSENLGWLNAKPGGAAGQGMVVSDFELTGWMWSENAGWVSLSCKNSSICASLPYGVTNDGTGHLGGYAWGENIGWVAFAPIGGGVSIDPSNGIFGGYGWSENAGWINFGGPAPAMFSLVTGWRCDPPPAQPTQSPMLSVYESAGVTFLAWSNVPLATGYDVVKGSLNSLRTTGSFAACTLGCLANNSTLGSVSDGGTPTLEDGFWYLVRGANCGGSGTYDSGEPSQVGSRDGGIAASGKGCP